MIVFRDFCPNNGEGVGDCEIQNLRGGIVLFGSNLKRLRLIKDVTSEEVASFVGVDEAVYLKWEKGDAEPWLDDLRNLAKFFHCTIDALVDASFDYESYLEILRRGKKI